MRVSHRSLSYYVSPKYDFNGKQVLSLLPNAAN